MAAVVTINKTLDIGQTEKLYIGTIALDNSYPTGGEAIDATGNESFDSMLFGHKNGYTFSLDVANQKVLAYQQSAATSALTQVPNATDLSAVTDLTFWAIGS